MPDGWNRHSLGLRVPSPQAFTCFGKVRFIVAWRPFEGNADGANVFLYLPHIWASAHAQLPVQNRAFGILCLGGETDYLLQVLSASIGINSMEVAWHSCWVGGNWLTLGLREPSPPGFTCFTDFSSSVGVLGIQLGECRRGKNFFTCRLWVSTCTRSLL